MIPIKPHLLFLFLSFNSIPGFSQTIDTALYRKDNLGSIKNQKRMVISGNNISTIIHNNGTIGKWPESPSFMWPNDSSGLNYIDGLTLLVSAEALTNKGQVIHPVETFYWEQMDNPFNFPGFPQSLSSEPLGFSPLSGYDNSEINFFARSDEPSSWPVIWSPALNLPESQNGNWLNRLFPFSQPANLETFYVMDDSKDFEFTYPFPSDRGRYYPVKNNEPTSGTTIPDELKQYTFNPSFRKGLGLRVESGTFQWNTSKLKNALFVINDIYNLSDFSYEKFVVGIYTDSGIGGTLDIESEEITYFDLVNNIAVLSDYGGKVPGRPDITLGIWGIVFIETPGNSNNSIDDDKDGIIDESQVNGIDDDNDWNLETDDIGADGLANTGDLGEADGIPTLGEPNFETTDADEIDMLRINSFSAIPVSDDGSESFWPKNDDVVWNTLNSNKISLFERGNDLKLIPSTNGLSLPVQSKIRLSYAIVFGIDSLDLVQNVKWAREAYSAGFTAGSIGVGVKENKMRPNKIQLNQNYPNPFNPTTSISFNLPFQSDVSLKVYDLLGREIQTLHNGNLNSGTHRFSFNGSKLTSGIYFVKLISGDFSETKKMVLMK